ncbi:DUF397 domain-containing protein [Streptomyces cavernicola]|uniref:DUF397 domain-containing protein n=1 Tax=Streptomyces cavernicola TaxID=3043613 RepID=A0ABT6SHB3_9ACTN|nr:DUF397 domain-containing protein [Streptomyces sp. B-S-A6]MDI3407254.1 DUF397 domain-containing protein [Streptomyces sp. B-S-A6]
MSTSELAWFKSSYSGSQGDDCVEVAMSGTGSESTGTVHVRDSKLRQSPQLAVTPEPWRRFLSYARHA